MERNIYKRVEGVVTRVIAGEMLLVPVSGDLADMQNIFLVDQVGAFIWDSLDGIRSHRDVLERVTGEFDVAEDRAGVDLDEFLGTLKQSGLIVEA